MGSGCRAKHTKFQPTEAEWKCPQCGGGPDVFFIDYFADRADDDCDLLHEDDYIVCTECDKSWGGRSLAATMAKRKDVEPCPHCQGTGVVQKCDNMVQNCTGKGDGDA